MSTATSSVRGIMQSRRCTFEKSRAFWNIFISGSTGAFESLSSILFWINESSSILLISVLVWWAIRTPAIRITPFETIEVNLEMG